MDIAVGFNSLTTTTHGSNVSLPTSGQPWREGGCELPNVHNHGGPLCATAGKEPRLRHAWNRRRWGAPWTFISRESRRCAPAVTTRIPPRTDLLHHTSLYQRRLGPKCQMCELSPNSAACECFAIMNFKPTFLKMADGRQF